MERSKGLVMENPFAFKVGQVFTGFGVGCGVGIGVGRPINLGGIPMLGEVMNATRGATDAVSGVAIHVNSSLRKLGLKSIEAGVGCGVGMGHGFGVGIALKPGVINQIQSCLGEVMAKMTKKLGGVPGFSIGQGLIAQSFPNRVSHVGETFKIGGQNSSQNILQMATAAESGPDSSVGETKPSLGSCPENVIGDLFNSSLTQDEKEMQLNELVNKFLPVNVFQVLLKHQKAIEELSEEGERLREVLIQELQVSPGKFQAGNHRIQKSDAACFDCFQCRRRRRKYRI